MTYDNAYKLYRDCGGRITAKEIAVKYGFDVEHFCEFVRLREMKKTWAERR